MAAKLFMHKLFKFKFLDARYDAFSTGEKAFYQHMISINVTYICKLS